MSLPAKTGHVVLRAYPATACPLHTACPYEHYYCWAIYASALGAVVSRKQVLRLSPRGKASGRTLEVRSSGVLFLGAHRASRCYKTQ